MFSHPASCPSWAYERHSNSAAVKERCLQFLIGLHEEPLSYQGILKDSREYHRGFFEGTTPPEAPYYAGHFRGEAFKCLEYCNVGVDADQRVGINAPLVRSRHSDMIGRIGIAISQIDGVLADADPEDPVSDEELVQMVVPLAALFLQLFLTLHPYVNGNGHMGRALVWVLFARFGIWPKSWPLDTSPPYYDLLSKHRDGGEGRDPLEDLLYRAISGETIPEGPNTVADKAWLEVVAAGEAAAASNSNASTSAQSIDAGEAKFQSSPSQDSMAK